jgi:hypothetical protein
MTTTVYLIAAIVFILLAFRVIRLFSLRSKATQKYIPVVSAFELAIWTLLIFWAMHIFLADKLYYSWLLMLLVFVFTLLIVWFYIKDIVAGYLFQVRHNPTKNQTLQTGDVKGVIREIGLSQLTIELADGQWLRIPYSSLITQSLSLQSPHTIAPGEMMVKVPIHAKIDPGYFAKSIREALALSPWCVASKPITIQPDATEEGIMRISFFIIDPSYQTLAKDKLLSIVKLLQENK